MVDCADRFIFRPRERATGSTDSMRMDFPAGRGLMRAPPAFEKQSLFGQPLWPDDHEAIRFAQDRRRAAGRVSKLSSVASQAAIGSKSADVLHSEGAKVLSESKRVPPDLVAQHRSMACRPPSAPILANTRNPSHTPGRISLRFQTTHRTHFHKPPGSYKPQTCYPKQNPPPLGFDNTDNSLARTTSQDAFLRPGRVAQLQSFKPRPKSASSAQPIWQTETVGSAMPLTTTTASHFLFHSVGQQKPCRPPVDPAPYTHHALPAALGRTTSEDAFLAPPNSFLVAARQRLCRPPNNAAPYEHEGLEQALLPRTTSADAFISFPGRRVQQPIYPPHNPAPYASENGAFNATPTTTSRAEYSKMRLFTVTTLRANAAGQSKKDPNATVAAAIFGDDDY